MLDQNEKGKQFEEAVAQLLAGLAMQHPRLVTVEAKPRIDLQNDEYVIPDFHLTVELSHERRHYLIECQHREKASKGLLHKIQHVRNKQRWKTFLFLHPNTIPPELARALDSEGVMHLDLEAFELFVARLSASLGGQLEIRPEKVKPDGAMLATPPRRY